jgi:hypothetical protein
MIPSAFITAWRKNAPWRENSQVEQVEKNSLWPVFARTIWPPHLVYFNTILWSSKIGGRPSAQPFSPEYSRKLSTTTLEIGREGEHFVK